MSIASAVKKKSVPKPKYKTPKAKWRSEQAKKRKRKPDGTFA